MTTQEPPILFGDATAATVALLAAQLTVPVSARIPADRPDEFVTAYRVGGVARNLVVDDATMIIEAWSFQDERAQDLAQQARAAVHDSDGGRYGPQQLLVCDVVEVAGPALLPDPLSSQTRYTLTLQVSFRASNA